MLEPNDQFRLIFFCSMNNSVSIKHGLDSKHRFDFHNVPKFSDRKVWANSVDPDQTPRGAI